LDTVKTPVAPLVLEDLRAPCEACDLDESLGPADPLGTRDAERVELRRPVAKSEAKLKPPAAQLVDHRGVLGEPDRVLKRREDDRSSDADRDRPRSDCGEHWEERRQVAIVSDMVLREPDGLEAKRLRPLDLLEILAVDDVVRPVPARRVAEVVPETEIHA
jgi:hypothetical protein